MNAAESLSEQRRQILASLAARQRQLQEQVAPDSSTVVVAGDIGIDPTALDRALVIGYRFSAAERSTPRRIPARLVRMLLRRQQLGELETERHLEECGWFELNPLEVTGPFEVGTDEFRSVQDKYRAIVRALGRMGRKQRGFAHAQNWQYIAALTEEAKRLSEQLKTMTQHAQRGASTESKQ